MMIQTVKDTMPGVVGLGATGGSGFVGWLTQNGEPVLHAFANFGTGLAGVTTAAYYLFNWLKARKK